MELAHLCVCIRGQLTRTRRLPEYVAGAAPGESWSLERPPEAVDLP